jgi:large subunit ribosomal protein L32
VPDFRPDFFQEFHMPVQKSRKTPSKRGMHRSHDSLAKPALSVDPQSGETHLRHRITPDGFYRGKRVIEKPAEDESAQ